MSLQNRIWEGAPDEIDYRRGAVGTADTDRERTALARRSGGAGCTRAATRLQQTPPIVDVLRYGIRLSYVGILLVLRFGGDGPVTPTDPRFLLVMLAWLAGPSVASLVMTGLVSGKSGYRELFGRLMTWRVGAARYALALLLAPLVSAGLSHALSAFSPEFMPKIVTSTDTVAVLLMGLAYGLLGGGFLEELAGFLEELGSWRS